MVEERLVGVEEEVALGVADRHPELQCDQAAVGVGRSLRTVPHVDFALGNVALAERVRQEPNVPVGTGAEAGHHMVVDDAGEGAAVIPGESERASHARVNASDQRRIPIRVAPLRTATWPRARPSAAPPITSDAWWIRT